MSPALAVRFFTAEPPGKPQHCTFGFLFISKVYKILLREKILIPWKAVKGTWNSSLLQKIEFWEDGIMKLPETWQNVVEQNGECVTQ